MCEDQHRDKVYADATPSQTFVKPSLRMARSYSPTVLDGLAGCLILKGPIALKDRVTGCRRIAVIRIVARVRFDREALVVHH